MTDSRNHPNTGLPRGRTHLVEADESAVPVLRARVESVGSCLPERVQTTRELLESCSHRPEIDLEGVTGIATRRVCSPYEDSLTLAVGAARDCLAGSRHRPEELEMVVFCGIAKFDNALHHLRFEPSMSLLVREAIGAGNAMTFDLGNACAGMMTGVHVLHDFIRKGVVRCGMVVSGEYITHLAVNAAREVTDSHHLQAASLTVGDAGGAVILDRADGDTPGILSCVFATQAQHVNLCTGAPYPHGPGGEMETLSKEIHQAGISGTPLIVHRALEEAGVSLADIDLVIMHQTSVRAIEKCSALVSGFLGGDPARWLVNVDRCGNTASTSHFVALRRCISEGRIHSGDKVLLITQASGLVIGAVVFAVDSLGDSHGRMH